MLASIPSSSSKSNYFTCQTRNYGEWWGDYVLISTTRCPFTVRLNTSAWVFFAFRLPRNAVAGNRSNVLELSSATPYVAGRPVSMQRSAFGFGRGEHFQDGAFESDHRACAILKGMPPPGPCSRRVPAAKLCRRAGSALKIRRHDGPKISMGSGKHWLFSAVCAARVQRPFFPLLARRIQAAMIARVAQ